MRILLTATLLIACLHALSQNFSIQGQLLDKSTGESMPFVTVELLNTSFKTSSDLDGYYNLTNIPYGKYTLRISFVTYIEINHEFEYKNETAPLTLNFQMESLDSRRISAFPSEQYNSPEIIIEGTRANKKTPITFSEIITKDIARLNNGQDLPFLLRFTPSLVSTSDAGNGIGYTGLWIRGSDPSRINVTINGIPLNDPESQQVFWVNTPDFGSSVNNIQIQRGVGTSANGAASFGGAIKLETRALSTKPYAESNNNFGSFNTMRNQIAFGTGLIKDRFVLEGRLSSIRSDGYIDRARSNLRSYYFEGSYVLPKTSIKLTTFNGHEETYQSWAGTPAAVLSGNADSIAAFAARNFYNEKQIANLLNSGRTYNFYEYSNQVDNYGQNHWQLHIRQQLLDKLSLNLSGHYTRGEGYFEEFKEDEDYEDYGYTGISLDSNTTISQTDLIRRRWLKNDFYGVVGSLQYNSRKLESTLGFALNQYSGDHFGEIIWMQFAGDILRDDKYYRGSSLKNDGNVYWKSTWLITQKIDLYTDVQLRSVVYQTKGTDNDLRQYDVDTSFLFFNPKLGFNYSYNNKNRIYGSFAIGNKEPNRNDFVDSSNPSNVKAESMTDIEIGYSHQHKTFDLNVNGYWMNYTNQLVLTGELNDVGAPLRTNVDKSYRRGIEIEVQSKRNTGVNVGLNTTISENKISAFTETLYDYTNGFEIVNIDHDDTDISFSPSLIGAALVQYNKPFGNNRHSFEVALMNKYVGKQYLDNTSNDYLSIDAYFVTDFRINAIFNSSRNESLTLNFWINNLFDQKYSSNGYTYSYIYTERVSEKFYYPQAGRNYNIGIGIKI
jgi:iron complex outermembrane recepter protein